MVFYVCMWPILLWMDVCVCVCIVLFVMLLIFMCFIWFHGTAELNLANYSVVSHHLSLTLSLSLSNSLCPSLLLFPSLTPPTQLYILVTQSHSLSHSLFLSHFLRYYFYFLYSLGDQTIARHHHKRTETAPSMCACTSINIMCSRIWESTNVSLALKHLKPLLLPV